MTRRDICVLLTVVGIMAAGGGGAWWANTEDSTCTILGNCPSALPAAITTIVGAFVLLLGVIGLFVVMLSTPDRP